MPAFRNIFTFAHCSGLSAAGLVHHLPVNAARASVGPRIRVVLSDGTIVMGPGKADLLAAVASSGSIRSAAAELEMSYMRAWSLIRVMNEAFQTPLVEKVRGGADKGGARLTVRGRRVLQLYRRMERDARRAIAAAAREILAEL